jgi:hypothetical protein
VPISRHIIMNRSSSSPLPDLGSLCTLLPHFLAVLLHVAPDPLCRDLPRRQPHLSLLSRANSQQVRRSTFQPKRAA